MRQQTCSLATLPRVFSAECGSEQCYLGGGLDPDMEEALVLRWALSWQR